MYHHINNHTRNLVTISPGDFEKQIAYLAHKGYKTLNMAEALAYLRGGRPLHGREVLLTFDDGFLDNWVYAYPILHRYGLKAVLFLVTGFVEIDGAPRPHLGQVWQRKIEHRQLPIIPQHNDFDYKSVRIDRNSGCYVRWSELVQMQADGAFDIQAHGHFHGEYFCADKIVGFNTNANNRLALVTDGDCRPGIPVYEKKPALVQTRYFDDLRLRDHLAVYVSEHGGSNFFTRPKKDWEQELYRQSEEFIRQYGLQGTWEKMEDYERRVQEDLAVCRQAIEKNLKKPCLSIAWPWGGYNNRLIKLARELGYQAAFTTERGANSPGCDLLSLKRCVVKKGNLNWFTRQLFIYSRPQLSKAYLKVRGKI